MIQATTPKAEILVVDDNTVNLHLLVDVLQEQQYEVRAATNGARALATARSSPPDLIMLDITMPEMDGYEVCNRLKADESTRDIPVIFISALDEATDKVRGFEAGAVDYVTKPFQFEEIIARIENQLKIARLQKVLEQKNAELEEKNLELARKNEELAEAYHRAGTIFFAMSEVVPGAVVDERYRIEEKLGSGRFGVVYRATQIGLQRPIALKILRPKSGELSGEALERFRVEGIASCRINHPNAVIVLDFRVTSSGMAYLAMELLKGRTLGDELAARGPLPLDRCGQILTPVCSVLADAHSLGVFHRNVRLDSVFLHEGKDGETIKLLDFGLANLLDSDAGLESSSSGRQFASSHIAKDDVLGVGAMFYQMLSGVAPFEHPLDEATAIDLSVPVEPLLQHCPSVPEPVSNLIMRALDPNPDNRPSAKELGQEILRAVLTARMN